MEAAREADALNLLKLMRDESGESEECARTMKAVCEKSSPALLAGSRTGISLRLRNLKQIMKDLEGEA
jgi:hypothetical protein